ncbi:hypothetical protein B0H13DRAFT_1906492 [Mycena leptocephala]|nr:hypothetical protein B0H13DRAFT_1906492 [Mycena leptocephala]
MSQPSTLATRRLSCPSAAPARRRLPTAPARCFLPQSQLPISAPSTKISAKSGTCFSSPMCSVQLFCLRRHIPLELLLTWNRVDPLSGLTAVNKWLRRLSRLGVYYEHGGTIHGMIHRGVVHLLRWTIPFQPIALELRAQGVCLAASLLRSTSRRVLASELRAKSLFASQTIFSFVFTAQYLLFARRTGYRVRTTSPGVCVAAPHHLGALRRAVASEPRAQGVCVAALLLVSALRWVVVSEPPAKSLFASQTVSFVFTDTASEPRTHGVCVAAPHHLDVSRWTVASEMHDRGVCVVPHPHGASCPVPRTSRVHTSSSWYIALGYRAHGVCVAALYHLASEGAASQHFILTARRAVSHRNCPPLGRMALFPSSVASKVGRWALKNVVVWEQHKSAAGACTLSISVGCR